MTETAHAPHDDVTAALRAALEARRASQALALLNARTRFRFTGVYRPEPPLLRNVCLFDRENPSLNVSGATCALDATFCVLVWDTDQPYTVTDAAGDPALRPHTADGTVISYAGVPIRTPSGQIIGTLCHFDSRPRILPPAELAVMQAAASVFAPWLAAESRAAESLAGARPPA